MVDTNQQQTWPGSNDESNWKTEKNRREKVACPLFFSLLIVMGLLLLGPTACKSDEVKSPISGTLSLIAGDIGGLGQDDGVGSEARFRLGLLPGNAIVIGMAIDAAGNVYLADSVNHTIRKITSTGVVTTFAGTVGKAGNADGDGTAAQFNEPSGIAIDTSGNLYVSDYSNHTIRKITPSGVVTTLAGTAGKMGYLDGVGQAALFRYPQGIAVDNASNLYVVDSYKTIRKISPDGAVSTVASFKDNKFAAGITIDAAGNLYVTDSGTNIIRKITPAGSITTLAGQADIEGSDDGVGTGARFYSPDGITVDAKGNLYVTDGGNSTIRKISPAGIVITMAGTAKIKGSGNGTGRTAQFRSPRGIAADTAGSLYVADVGNSAIRKITPAGVVTTLAGKASEGGHADSVGAAAQFNNPCGITADSAGNIYVADRGNKVIRKITPTGVVTTLAGTPGKQGSADGSGAAALFDRPEDIAIDSAGNLYVADTGNSTIRKITPDGVVTTLAGKAGKKGSVDGPGDLARFDNPGGITVGVRGDIYVADGGNKTIRRITQDGRVTTIRINIDGSWPWLRKISFDRPRSITVDAASNLYVVDYSNDSIFKITQDGEVSLHAGDYSFGSSRGVSKDGPRSTARFRGPIGITSDESGNLYVADTNSHAVRKVTQAGAVNTVAGVIDKQGIVTGNLPGGLDRPERLTRIGPNTFAITTGNAILKLSIQ